MYFCNKSNTLIINKINVCLCSSIVSSTQLLCRKHRYDLLKLEIFQTSFQQSLQFKVNLKETCAISNSAYSQSDKILFWENLLQADFFDIYSCKQSVTEHRNIYAQQRGLHSGASTAIITEQNYITYVHFLKKTQNESLLVEIYKFSSRWVMIRKRNMK